MVWFLYFAQQILEKGMFLGLEKGTFLGLDKWIVGLLVNLPTPSTLWLLVST